MKEAALETKLSNAVKKVGGYSIKLPAAWYIGIPDRLILLPGKVIFVELKTSRGVLSPAQKNWGSRLTKLGLTYFIIKGPAQLERFLHEQVLVHRQSDPPP